MKSISVSSTVRSRTVIAIGASLLLHALILFFAAAHHPPVRLAESSAPIDGPLTVHLIPQTPAPEVTAPAAMTPPHPQPKKTRHSNPLRHPQKDIARNKTKSIPKSPGPAALPADMTDMINAARERRRAAGIPEPDDSRDDKKHADDNAIAVANIAHSMQMQARGRNDIGGLFEITFMGVRTANFVFYGWDERRRSEARQAVEVDAGLNGDVELAIVRKMIELIRRYRDGDFDWDSHRLGRVVVLSARPKDNAELEAFLKAECFGVSR